MTHEQELLARAMSHIDDDMLLAAHAPRKKIRRVIPVAVAACLIAAILVAFPYLRTAINTETDLFGPGDENMDMENVGGLKPETYPYAQMGIPVSLGGTTITLTATTETTATFTVVKTDDTPIYAMLYDRMNNALASTEPDYKDNGVIIRPHTIHLYVNGAEQPVYRLPKAPGTYTVVVDFAIIRNGAYPMQEHLGFYAYIGEDGAAVTERFSLEVIPPDTAEGTETDAVSTDTDEPVDTTQ